MTSATILIAYDGEALRSPGTMEVRDLAPALMAIADLFDEANKVINPDFESAVQVRIHPGFKPGSFEVQLSVHYPIIDTVLKLFAGDRGSGLANLLEVLNFVTGGLVTAGIGTGLIALVRWVRSRPVKKVELVDPDGARVSVEGEEIVVRRQVAAVFNDLGVRRALAAVLAPLRRDGIDCFEIRSGEKGQPPIERVTQTELPSFEPPLPAVIPPKPITDNRYQQAFTIISLTFKEGNKWRLSDGTNILNVTIEDVDFLRRIDNREVSFAKDDIIRCEVAQKQVATQDGLRTEHAILRVLEHYHAPRQTVLPLTTTPTAVPPTPPATDQKGPPTVPAAKRRHKRTNKK